MDTARALDIIGGNQLWVEAWADYLRHRPLPRSSKPLTLLLDAPWGFAHQTFATRGHAVLLYSDNPCSEYLADLWDLGPRGLLHGNLSLAAFWDVLDLLLDPARTDERVCFPALPATPLTQRERDVLRCCAQRGSLEAAAAALQLSLGTLRNHLSSIYAKLGLAGFSELSAHYYGVRQRHNARVFTAHP